MAENTLRVRITALDEASAIVETFKKKLSSVKGPAQQAEGAIKSVNDRNAQMARAARSQTLPDMSKHFRDISRNAFGAFRNVGRLSGEMGTLTELAGAGGLAGAALGVAMLTKRWADQGVALKNTAANIGITSGQLIRYQRAAALTGVSSGTVSTGLQNFNSGLFQGLAGNNPAMVNSLRVLGIHAGFAKHRLEPLSVLLPQVAKAIQGMSPQGQLAVVDKLGLGSGMLPFLRQYPRMQREMAHMKREGLTSASFAGSAKLYEDFAKLDTAAILLRNELGLRFAPALTGSVAQLTVFARLLGKFDPNAVAPGLAPGLNDAEKWSSSAGKWLHNSVVNGWRELNGTRAYKTATLPAAVEAQVRAEAARRGLNPNRMVALARAEGGTGKVSPAGAIGTMQLMPGTAAQEGVNPYNQKQNIVGGEGYFQQLLARYHGNYAVADAAYNAGPGGRGVEHFYHTGDESRLPTETRRYVRTIEGIEKRQPMMAPAIALPLPPPPQPPMTGSVTVSIDHSNVPPGVSTKVTSDGSVQVGALRINRAMEAYP